MKLSHREYYYTVRGDKNSEVVDVLFKNSDSNFAIQFSDTPLGPDTATEPAQLVHESSSWLQSAAQSVLGSLERAKKLAAETARQMAEEKVKLERQQAAEQKERETLPRKDQKKDVPEK